MYGLRTEKTGDNKPGNEATGEKRRQVMARHVLLKSVWILAILFAAAILTVYAGESPNGPKNTAYGAFSFGTGAGHFSFDAPNKGSWGYYEESGVWAGCWAHIKPIKLFFGTYYGNAPDLDGDPYVVVMAKAVEGEEFFNPPPDFPFPPEAEPPYQDIAGFYKVAAMGDGGPGYENDWIVPMFPIPDTPEGLPSLCVMLGVCGSGEEQAQTLFELAASGQFWATGPIFGGDITVKHKDKADRK
jgi:hypothetical protein